jgi:hypothetical protein
MVVSPSDLIMVKKLEASPEWYYELDYDPLPPWQRVTQPAFFRFAEGDRWVPVPESISIF